MRGSVGDLGEFGLIAAITAGLEQPAAVVVGPGDDCAVFRPSGDVAVSTDTMIEDVHFKKSWSSPNDVGRKAVAAALSDLNAMAARPVGVVVALSLPADTPGEWALEFSRGVKSECELAGAALMGGDITRGAAIGVTVTVFGDLEGRTPLLRSGACPGDVVAYVGRVGMAAAGLAVLSRGFRSPAAVVRAQRYPEIPYGEGIAAHAAGATSLIDCSDGPLADLGHVAKASGVSIDLDPAAFDVDEAQTTVAAAIGGGNPLTYILTGGEDHALFGTFPGPDAVPAGWRVVGRVAEPTASEDGTPQPGVTVAGKPWDAETPAGWTHF